MALTEQSVSEGELRRRFNVGNYVRRVATEELLAEVRRDGHPNSEHSGEPFCTRRQILAYFGAEGQRVAIVHQDPRLDGALGASGQPDPKMLVEQGVEYRVPRARGHAG